MVVKPSTYRRWTAAELKKVIAMLQHPDFDSKDIDPDLHQRMAKAVDDAQPPRHAVAYFGNKP